MDFIFKVDPILRNIKVPDAFTVLTMDHNIHKLVFVCPYYEDFAFDSASIVFMIDAPDGKQYIIPAEDYESFPNSPAPYVKFTLTLKSYITSVVGYMSFCITADIISSGNVIEKSWHSKNVSISIGGHINNDDSEDIPEEDVPTINQRLNNLDSKVGRLQTTVNGMANGSPTPVATVAEMTDESAVYLYTGSETGYTAGNWYYYNGSAWTSGGVYGGAVTSTTFDKHGVPADDFAVGEALAEKADADDVGDLLQLTTTAKDSLVSAVNEVNEAVTGINERLDDTNAETTDIRVGADGTTYASAGAAVRGQITDVKSALGAEIDVGTLLDGFYVHKNNGRAYESNASCATDFISICPGAQLHFSGLYLEANRGVCFYDSDKAFISSVPFSEFTTEISATAPIDAMYVRASGRYGDPVFIEYTNSVNWLSGQIVALHDKDSEFAADFLQSEVDLFNCFEGSVAVPIRANEMFNANLQQFVPNPNRISTDPPVKVKKGDKLSFIVGESEKYYIAYFNKVGSTGDKNTDYQYIAGSGSGWKTASAEYSIDADKYAYITIANSDDSAISPTIENTVVTLVRDISSNNGDSLPDYWQSYLDTKASAINAALNDIGGDGDGFIFFTDVHWAHNQKFTPFIIDKLRSKTTLHSVFCGGDIFDTSTGGFESYMQAFRSLPVLTARGNHDQNPIATDSSDIVSDAEFYNMILRPVVYDAELSNQIYFYKDNNAQKIRYIFTDSGCNWITTLDSTQLSWLRERITELDSDWSCLVVQHIVFNGAASDVGSLSFAGQGNTLINAINDMWSAINCTFLGIVSGHVHRDYSVYDATHNYPIIATSCDANGTTRTDYDPLNTGESGTTNEHILDVFLIDKTNRTIKTIRIGSGSDRTFTY